MNSSAEANRKFDNTYYGMTTPPFFDPQEAFLPFAVGEFSLTSALTEVVFLSLYPSRTQLMPLILSLECLGNRKLQFIPLDKPQLLSPVASLSST